MPQEMIKNNFIEESCFTIFLQIIHSLLDFLVYISLKLTSLRRKVLFQHQHMKEDVFYIEKNSRAYLSKVPNHIALAFIEPTFSLDDVAKLVFWAIASGSTTVSLYDYKGFIKIHQIELLNKLAKFHKLIHLRNNFKLKWNDNSQNVELNGNGSNSNDSQVINICLLSKQDGKADIVKAAQSLAQRVADGSIEVQNVDEPLISNALLTNHGLPDPELLIRFGLAHSNVGFPPWQIRLSEIHDIDTHHGVDVQDFFQILLKYSKCEQRFGR